MRASVLILGFLASVSYALPSAQQVCVGVRPPIKQSTMNGGTNAQQRGGFCDTGASLGDSSACCSSLSCDAKNGTATCV
ncbi:hypothetical protein N7532_010034 [Penicillium argentinense]|uniref:Hydrophobin n=1 Tax=Penicillium argentinense TaxID=1131581 RepID=A0A9W9ENT7_9EURO|nr:uncharacterized protein N7532_010034 [Penicillium argentinense]KAJ5085263.1 hypothetical protein N7532_010034 [Penicillium argentinense]